MSRIDISEMTLEEKRKMARALLAKKKASSPSLHYTEQTMDLFAHSSSVDHEEAKKFGRWVDDASRDGLYTFESPRAGPQTSETLVDRADGTQLRCINMSSYHYLGYGTHPAVIDAAKDALDRYGLGAGSSPVISGTMRVHRALEEELADFYGLPDRSVSLFSSGYAVNLGAIAAFVKSGHHVVMDSAAHMSIVEGAQLSGAQVSVFRHNDPDDLARVLQKIDAANNRTLVCVEGVYSADGDFGRLREIVDVTKSNGAFILVDEAHSVLVAGENGRGVAEAAGVLEDVDLYVLTFSKAFGAVGGALIARSDVAKYANWYARARMFSCALGPAAAGGIRKALELARTEDGAARRRRLLENAAYFRTALRRYVDIGVSESWIVPVIFGVERITLPLNDHLQRSGLDGSIMQFPAVPRGGARVRLFVTSEHTRAQLDRAVTILGEAADKFGFRRKASKG